MFVSASFPARAREAIKLDVLYHQHLTSHAAWASSTQRSSAPMDSATQRDTAFARPTGLPDGFLELSNWNRDRVPSSSCRMPITQSVSFCVTCPPEHLSPLHEQNWSLGGVARARARSISLWVDDERARGREGAGKEGTEGRGRGRALVEGRIKSRGSSRRPP